MFKFFGSQQKLVVYQVYTGTKRLFGRENYQSPKSDKFFELFGAFFEDDAPRPDASSALTRFSLFLFMYFPTPEEYVLSVSFGATFFFPERASFSKSS